MRQDRRAALLTPGGYDGPTEWVFTASGTFIAPVAGTYQVRVLSGSGAGGAKGSDTWVGGFWEVIRGGGGGAGSFFHAQSNSVSLSKNEEITITVGTGGVAPGGQGGVSRFGSIMSANGGYGGANGGNATSSNGAGTGGAAGDGTTGYKGGNGEAGYTNTAAGAGGTPISVTIGGVTRTSGAGGGYVGNSIVAPTNGDDGLVYIVLL